MRRSERSLLHHSRRQRHLVPPLIFPLQSPSMTPIHWNKVFQTPSTTRMRRILWTTRKALHHGIQCNNVSRLWFMKTIPPPKWPSHTKSLIPPKCESDTRKTLVLDLDETLVHCSTAELLDADHTFPVEFNGQQYRVYARTRPHCENFLAALSKHYEIIIFTASQVLPSLK